jgi:HEAT repeat protein
VLPALAALLACSVALLVWSVFALFTFEEACVRHEGAMQSATLARVAAVRQRGRTQVARRGELVREPSTQAQARAMVAFCDTASPADVADLRDVALSAQSPLAAGNAVRALGRLGVLARDPALLALLEDPRPRVRDETILALGECRDPQAIAPLEAFALGSDPKARILAIRALGRIGGARARAAARR